ncbi:hypothetical protein JHK85_046805 [Glycine max]|nr:hypothetical protein JHK85_046805 [Glycine max]
MGCVFGKEASKKKEEVEVARAEDGVAQNSGNVKVGGEEEKSKRPKGERRRSSKPNPRLSNPPNHVHGEQVAAGWPSWLSKVAGEAINGLVPRRADTFEKLNKFFTSKPYACEPSSLPKYPPSKEMDTKLRDEEARRLRAAGKANAAGVKKSRPRDRGGRGISVPDSNAELQANIDRWRLVTHANAKSKSEKFPPPHEDGTLGYPLGSSHHMDPIFDPPDVPFSSTNLSYPKANFQTWSGPLVEPSVDAPRRKKNMAGNGHRQSKKDSYR